MMLMDKRNSKDPGEPEIQWISYHEFYNRVETDITFAQGFLSYCWENGYRFDRVFKNPGDIPHLSHKQVAKLAKATWPTFYLQVVDTVNTWVN